MRFTQDGKYTQDDIFISILKEEHKPVISGFISGNAELDEFLQKDALEYQRLHLGATYLLFEKGSKKLLAYITLSMGALKLPEKRDEFVFKGKKLSQYPKIFPSQFPALLIGKLATDKREEKKHAASLLLDFALRFALNEWDKLGCAYLLAHAYTAPDVLKWYSARGFETHFNPANRETIPLYMELAP